MSTIKIHNNTAWPTQIDTTMVAQLKISDFVYNTTILKEIIMEGDKKPVSITCHSLCNDPAKNMSIKR